MKIKDIKITFNAGNGGYFNAIAIVEENGCEFTGQSCGRSNALVAAKEALKMAVQSVGCHMATNVRCETTVEWD